MSSNKINRVAIIGSGTMGIGIAQNCAQAGISVNLIDVNQKALDDAAVQLKTNLKLFKEYKLIEEEPENILSRINPSLMESFDRHIDGCGYIAEAVPEVLEIKKELFARIENSNSTSIIASNSSSFTIDELVQGMRYPGRLIGVHYFNPAHIIPAVEIHWGEKTSDEVINSTRELMLRVGKKPVMVKKPMPGFIVNRLTGALQREIDYLLAEGAVSAEDLDTAVKGSIGFRLACLGPQEIEDMIGMDISVRSSKRIYKVLNNSIEPLPIKTERLEAGLLGIKSGRGWYDYSDKPKSQILDDKNRKLLKQLLVFNSREKNSPSPECKDTEPKTK